MTESEIDVLLWRPKDADDAAMRAGVLAEVERLQAALPGHVCAFTPGCPAGSMPSLAHAEAGGPGLSRPDALLHIRPFDAAAEQALAGLGDRLARSVERAEVFACIRHSVLPGYDTIRLFFGFQRLEHQTREACHDYWLNVHADFGRRLIPPYSYHQLHVQAEATARAAAATGLPASVLDGVAEVYFPDIPAFIAQLSRPDVASEALEDERNFIDHARSLFWIYDMRAEQEPA
jgi:hypothetical protein